MIRPLLEPTFEFKPTTKTLNSSKIIHRNTTEVSDAANRTSRSIGHVRPLSEIEKRKNLPTRKPKTVGDVWRAFDREKEHETKEEEDEWKREKEGKDQKRDNGDPETWQRNLDRFPKKFRLRFISIDISFH